MTEKTCSCRDFDKPGDAPQPADRSGVSGRRPGEISAAAREMLRQAAVPAGFKAAVLAASPGHPAAPGAAAPRLAPRMTTLQRSAPVTRWRSDPEENTAWAGQEVDGSAWSEDGDFPDSSPANGTSDEPWPWQGGETAGETIDTPGKPRLLADLGLDLTWAPHATPILHTVARTPIAGLVSNSYLTFWGGGEVFMLGGEGDPKGEPVGQERQQACVTCRLIVLSGRAKKTRKTWEDGAAEVPSDAAMYAAHNAAKAYYEKHRGSGICLRLVHLRSKGSESHEFYDREKRKWVRKRSVADLQKHVTFDDSGRRIECFSEVLAIYHGEKPKSTVDVLSNLLKLTRYDSQEKAKRFSVPIHKLYLWSCYGSENIKFKSKSVTSFIEQVGERRKGQIAGKKVDPCCPPLCLYTAPDLDLTEAAEKLEGLADNPDDKKKNTFEAALKRVNDAKDSGGTFPAPLGLQSPRKTDKGIRYELTLLSPFQMLREYCVGAPPTLKQAKHEKIFTDVAVSHGTCQMMSAIFRGLPKKKRLAKLKRVGCR